MNEAKTNAAVAVKPMRFGRALHMDLSRASDTDLDRAFRTLDDYDTAGKASAYTEELIDERVAAIFDEQDRRAGQEPVFIPRQPGLRDLHEARERQEAAESIGEDDDAADATLSAGPDDDADDASLDVDAPSPEEQALGRTLADQPQLDGLVPGETSAI